MKLEEARELFKAVDEVDTLAQKCIADNLRDVPNETRRSISMRTGWYQASNILRKIHRKVSEKLEPWEFDAGDILQERDSLYQIIDENVEKEGMVGCVARRLKDGEVEYFGRNPDMKGRYNGVLEVYRIDLEKDVDV